VDRGAAVVADHEVEAVAAAIPVAAVTVIGRETEALES